MSLLFGRLTQNFVEFGQTINAANTPGDQQAMSQAMVPAAAAAFRHAAALNASYLVYIGEITSCSHTYLV
jgi:ATP-binding cassette, subfamily B (MDR/TAP), member 1